VIRRSSACGNTGDRASRRSPQCSRPGPLLYRLTVIGSTLVRLATFNVLHGRQILDDGRPSLTTSGTATVHPLIDAVATLDADVVALQELVR